MSNPIMELKATNGTVLVYDDHAEIKRKGFFAFASQGIKGDRSFFYTNLSGLDYKKPSLVSNGYLHFISAGTSDQSLKSGILRTSANVSEDSNTVILRAFNRHTPEESEKLYQLLMQLIKSAHNQSHQNSSVSQADEISKYKRLLDDGTITKSEFEQKKKQLLNL